MKFNKNLFLILTSFFLLNEIFSIISAFRMHLIIQVIFLVKIHKLRKELYWRKWYFFFFCWVFTMQFRCKMLKSYGTVLTPNALALFASILYPLSAII